MIYYDFMNVINNLPDKFLLKKKFYDSVKVNHKMNDSYTHKEKSFNININKRFQVMAEEESTVALSEKATDDEKLMEKIKLDALVSDLSQDYSKYLKVNVVAEKAALEDEIEDILTRLDEFTSLVDMVRGDNALCLNTTLPEIYSKCEEMEKMFNKVDKLEQMVLKIKQNLDIMEEKVAEAEERLDTSSVKKLFNTLQKPLFSKRSSESKKQMKYEPPEIFKTEDFFVCQEKSPTAEKDDA